jgi:hypothetical protein
MKERKLDERELGERNFDGRKTGKLRNFKA